MCIGLNILLIITLKNNFQATEATLILTSIVLLGLSRLSLEAFILKNSSKVFLITLFAIAITWGVFHYGESLAHATFSNALPLEHSLNFIQICAAILILINFALSIGLQIIAPIIGKQEHLSRFYIHLKNGFYTNTVFDRIVGTLDTTKKF